MSSDPISLARSLYAALEAGDHGEALRDLFADTAVTIEHPNALKPNGARSSLDQMLAASEAGVTMLTSQSYAVQSAVAVDNTAILRLTWTGIVADDIGPFHAGQQLVARIAQFIETDGERITSIETYDCYEPFAAS